VGKILFWFIVIMAVLIGARLLSRSATRSAPTGKLGKAPASDGDMSGAEAMVRCQHCGIHLPRSEAFLSSGRTWCGPEHARLGQDATEERSG